MEVSRAGYVSKVGRVPTRKASVGRNPYVIPLRSACQPGNIRPHRVCVTRAAVSIQTFLHDMPPVNKALTQLGGLLVGALLGATVGVRMEYALSRGGDGLLRGIYGLLLGAPTGAMIFVFIMAMLMA